MISIINRSPAGHYQNFKKQQFALKIDQHVVCEFEQVPIEGGVVGLLERAIAAIKAKRSEDLSQSAKTRLFGTKPTSKE